MGWGLIVLGYAVLIGVAVLLFVGSARSDVTECDCVDPAPTTHYDANGYESWCGRCGGSIR